MSRITTFVAAFALCAAAHAATPFVDVGKQEPITILTPSTPWLPAGTTRRRSGSYKNNTARSSEVSSQAASQMRS